MTVHLDLNKAHLTRQHGDLLAVYTWINDERALVLLPAYRKRASWYCLLESAAYKYDDDRYLTQQAVVACDVLGIEPSRANWLRIASIIHEGLPDLIRMPSAPPVQMGAAVGQAVIKEGGKILTGQDVRLPVETGATYG